ncbi:hypothetical protein [Actinopolyspora halophila]|uniref:hypothetical protein n=1 Tax=Actinopolyspora halophila TaxID=1850 RepID=UPI000372242A|nr:hypothetical protein [Actinopolyspora halophila]
MSPEVLLHRPPGLLVVLGAVTALAIGSALLPLLPLRPRNGRRSGPAPAGRRARALRRC